MLERLCQNCGKKRPKTMAKINRYRDDDVYRKEIWCLECVQGKNPVREGFDLPPGWE